MLYRRTNVNYDALQELKPGAIIRFTKWGDDNPHDRVVYLGPSSRGPHWGYLAMWLFTYWHCKSSHMWEKVE